MLQRKAKAKDEPADGVRSGALQKDLLCLLDDVAVVVGRIVEVAEEDGGRGVLVISDEDVARVELLEVMLTVVRQFDLGHLVEPAFDLVDGLQLMVWKDDENESGDEYHQVKKPFN